ncbi:anti-sigma factor family protein [Dactylosporangium sp. CA-092794]|uniref:anti-sigma factor family protein n=1 Tax=Dactylosporangium sp. CA-092794 TaxID=3239929 RepID=UPI003D94A63D
MLGALSPPEREAYERHLAGCAECRAEVAEFSDLPGLLGRLDPEVAARIALASDPPDLDASPVASGAERWAGPTVAPGGDEAAVWAGPTFAASGGTPGKVNGAAVDPLLPRVLDRARSVRRTERRRRRWRTAGTALVAAFLGVVAVIGVRAAGVGQPDYVAMQEVAATVPVTASLALSSDDEGTLVRMRCAYKEGQGSSTPWTYKLVVVPRSGQPEEIDTWSARSGDELQLTAHTAIPRTNIVRIEIRKGDGTPLLES